MRTRHAFLAAALIVVAMAARRLPDREVYFSPNGGATAAVVSEVDGARESVLVQAYSFTSEPIAQALVRARCRGVDVRVVLDKGQPHAHGSQWPALLAARIPTRVDRKHAIAHNKVMVIDGATVLTGSFNFSAGADAQNAENMLILRDTELAKLYAENWQKHAAHSEALKPHSGP